VACGVAACSHSMLRATKVESVNLQTRASEDDDSDEVVPARLSREIRAGASCSSSVLPRLLLPWLDVSSEIEGLASGFATCTLRITRPFVELGAALEAAVVVVVVTTASGVGGSLMLLWRRWRLLGVDAESAEVDTDAIPPAVLEVEESTELESGFCDVISMRHSFSMHSNAASRSTNDENEYYNAYISLRSAADGEI